MCVKGDGRGIGRAHNTKEQFRCVYNIKEPRATTTDYLIVPAYLSRNLLVPKYHATKCL